MLADQHCFWPEGIARDAKGQLPLQISPEFVRSFDGQAHQMIDAMAAAVGNAYAGLNWLRAQPPDLEEVRQVLHDIAKNGKRAAEVVARLRELAKKVPTADGAPDP